MWANFCSWDWYVSFCIFKVLTRSLNWFTSLVFDLSCSLRSSISFFKMSLLEGSSRLLYKRTLLFFASIPFDCCCKQHLADSINQSINQFYLSSIAWGVVAQFPEPGAHVLSAGAFRIKLEFRNVGFCGKGKTGVPGEKPLGAEKRTNNKLNPHMTSSPGIEPGPHWWKASSLTTAPSLLLLLLYFPDWSCLFCGFFLNKSGCTG